MVARPSLGKKSKKAKKNVLDRKPKITITSLGNGDRDFDFMPNLNKTGSANQQKIIQSLKDGTYQPFMASVEYKAEFFGKTKDLKKAEPMSDIYLSTIQDKFEYTAAQYEKTRTQSYSNLELNIKTFEKTNIPIYPRYYHNPLQYFDHVLLADGYTNSYAGTVVDVYVDFIMPKILKPVLKLRNPSKTPDPEKQQEIIKSNQEIIEKLIEVDNFFSNDGAKVQDEYLGIPIQGKFKSLIRNHLVFGRNCIVFENWADLPHFKDSKGTEFRDIPNVLKSQQSIDMGMAEIDIYTGKLGGIWMYNSVPFIPINRMIYLVNNPASPMIGSLYYGFSIMQRAIDAIRLLRRLLARNFAQYIRTSYSGMGMFLFDSTQYDETTRTAIRTQIVNNWKAGEIGIIDYANIENFKFEEMKISSDIADLIELKKSLIKLIVGILGMPESLIFDEGSATRDTLVGRIISFLNQQITQLRSSISEQIASQWYMRNFRILYKEKPELLELFTIGVEFEEMDLETKTEKVQRLLQEIQLNPYTDKHIGEELNDPNYLNNIDPEKKKQDQEQKMNNPFGVGPPKPKGQTFNVKEPSSSKQAQYKVTPV